MLKQTEMPDVKAEMPDVKAEMPDVKANRDARC